MITLAFLIGFGFGGLTIIAATSYLISEGYLKRSWPDGEK